MSQQNRIVWQEGMFLSPQHFQQWDRFAAGETWFRHTSLNPYAWGVRRIVFDLEALENKRLALDRIEAVLPDGTVVRAPLVDPLPPARQLEEIFTPQMTEMNVYLALPDNRPGVPVCRLGGHQGTVESPHLAETVEVEDQNSPGKTIDMSTARQNLKLVLSGENLDGTLALKLGRIKRDSDARIIMDTSYAPPALSLEAAGPVPELLRSILEALAAKSSTLSDQNRQRGGGMVEFGSGNIGNFWLLHTVNSYIPVVSHLQDMVETHPLVLYRSLIQLAGSLCTFCFQLHPREVPSYDHDDLGGTFSKLTRIILELLETVMPSAFTDIALTRRDDTMLIGEVKDEAVLAGDCHWYLSVSGDMPEARVRDEAPSQVIIGSPHNIDFLVKTATPGLALVHTPVPPRDFPLKAGHTYFKLESDGDIWETIRESGSVAIYLGGSELRGCQYQLIAMR